MADAAAMSFDPRTHQDPPASLIALGAARPSGAVPALFEPHSARAAGPAAVLAAWRAGKHPATLRCYAQDLIDLASWCACPVDDAIAQLLASTAGAAHQVALGYLAFLEYRGLSSATCARRMATLRSLTHAARLVGQITWSLELPTPRVVPYRDTRGPGRAGFLQVVAAAATQRDPVRTRNLAILWLLYGRALRRSEVVGLRYPEDLDLAGSRISILGKHRSQREWITIPPATIRALDAWVTLRGNRSGPVFSRLDRAAHHELEPRPLSGLAIAHLVRDLGKRAGITVRPHGLRHAAITEVLDVTRGDYRSAQRFGRISKADTLKYYDDNREDLGGNAAKLIAP